MATSKENCNGGYVVALIDKSDKKKFECMLCLSIIKKATHGCVKHVFCFDCLQQYIKSNKRKKIQKCPAGCQQTFNINQLSTNDPFDQLINQIHCKCLFCGWNGELLDFFKSHKGKCEDEIIPCQFCGMGLKRKDMNRHLKDECSHIPVVCQGGQKNFSFVDHDTRRNTSAYESQQHLSLIASNFTFENKLLKIENKKLKEETKQLKEQNNLIKEENIQVKEENNHIKEKLELLETNIKVLTWKVNIPDILLTEPANKIFHFPAVDEMYIKDNYLSSADDLFNCFNKNNFSWIIEHLVSRCDVLNNHKQQLHELLSSTKTIMFRAMPGFFRQEFYFFQIDSFKYYKCGTFSLKKDGNIFYIENLDDDYRLEFYISKWFIRTNESMMEVDITKPDERFIVYKPTFVLSSKYFTLHGHESIFGSLW